jgi:hypothetical protein
MTRLGEVIMGTNEVLRARQDDRSAASRVRTLRTEGGMAFAVNCFCHGSLECNCKKFKRSCTLQLTMLWISRIFSRRVSRRFVSSYICSKNCKAVSTSPSIAPAQRVRVLVPQPRDFLPQFLNCVEKRRLKCMWQVRLQVLCK